MAMHINRMLPTNFRIYEILLPNYPKNPLITNSPYGERGQNIMFSLYAQHVYAALLLRNKLEITTEKKGHHFHHTL